MTKIRSVDRYSGGGNSRLIVPFTLATALHAVVISSLGFSPNKQRLQPQQPLEVIFVHESSVKKPEKADYLAQVSAEGASDQHANVNPAAPLLAPMPDRQAQIAMATQPAAADVANESTRFGSKPMSQVNVAVSTPVDRAVVDARRHEMTVAQSSDPSRSATKSSPATVSEQQSPVRDAVVASDNPDNSANAERLISSSFAMASLSAEIDQRLESRSRRLRQKFVSSSTHEYRYAAYMEAWRSKVERIGNLNYPDEARQQRLSGNLLLDVALRPDGSVADIVIRRPSGFKELDAAAIRIVRLAAPFAPFPDDIRRDTDLLHITRSWQFMHNHQLTTKS